MPISYQNPYEDIGKNDAKNGTDNAIARRLLSTRQAITDAMPQTLPEFQSARNRTANQYQAKRQDTQDVLQRRFAAMGNLNSGEATKQLALANQGFAEQENQAQQDIDAQEQQQLAQMREAEVQRAFQQGALDTDNELKNKQFELDKTTKADQMDLAKKQFQRESLESAFNAAMAHAESSDQDTFSRQLQAYLDMFKPFSGGTFGGAQTGGTPAQAGGVPSQNKLPPPLPSPAASPGFSQPKGGTAVQVPTVNPNAPGAPTGYLMSDPDSGIRFIRASDGYDYTENGAMKRKSGSSGGWQMVTR